MATTHPIDAYVKKVSFMRHEQKEYFRTRAYEHLQKAKALKKEVDALTLGFMNAITENGTVINTNQPE